MIFISVVQTYKLSIYFGWRELDSKLLEYSIEYWMYYDNRHLNTELNNECTMTTDSEKICLDSLIGFSIQ